MRFLLFFLLVSFILAGMAPVYAQSNSAIIQIKNFEFELVEPSGIAIQIYQDNENVLFKTMTLTSNPQTISDLPSNHGYIFKVIKNGIVSATTSLKSNLSSPIEILIPNDGGMKFKVKFNDNSPISNAKVIVKSLDNTAQVTAVTNSAGETGRYWLQSTTTDSFYYAEVLLRDKISYIYTPIKTQSGLPIDFEIKTPWPKEINRIDVNIIKENRKVSTYDGIFLVKLYNSKGVKVSESSVTKGSTVFTLLPVDQYEFKVYHKQNNTDSFELWSAYRTVLTSNTSINIENLSDSGKTGKNCNCVAFRLDDVQDYFLSNSQKAIIQTFAGKSVPLTIGVIGGLIGSDAELVNVISNGIKNSKLEIASHSWNNSPITIFTQPQQEKILKDTNKVIHDTFGITPRVFIPPENVFDKSTITLLRANNFTHLSSSFNYDSPPFALSNSTFYRFPQSAQTAILDASSNLWIHENRTKTFGDVQTSIAGYGFAVVMMHPPDFSINDLGVYKNTPNQQYLDELGLLIDQIKNSGYTIVPISQINLDSTPVQLSPEKTMPKTIHCNCVAFRIDNVQDFWLNDVQVELIQTFEERDLDITVGILGKFFGQDPITVQQLNSTINNKKIQLKVANSGWEFIDHSKFGLEEQSSSIQQTNEKINSILKKKSITFIPPLGMFNEQTLTALNQNNIKFISSNLQQDKFLHSDSNKITHIPNTLIASNILDDDPFVSGTIAEQAITKINSNFEKYGYSVISLQPSDFAIKDEQQSQNKIDVTKLNKFNLILDKLQKNNIVVVTSDQIPKILWANSLEIPDWVRNNAGWWSEGTIGDADFSRGIEYMIKEGIIKIPQIPSPGQNSGIPDWVRNNAGWWSEGLISDGEFVSGLEYLIKIGAVRVS